MEETRKTRIVSLYDWIENIVVALVFVMLILTFAFRTFTVDGISMSPTLETGDFMFAYRLFYTPKSGDIILIDATNNYGKPLVKRVVAVEGQTLNIDENGTITVDGAVFPYAGDHNPDNVRGDTSFPLTVPDGYVFVMGDNRGNSLDSRYRAVGFIDMRSIVGRELYVIHK